jgi:Receptor family ligand binding region
MAIEHFNARNPTVVPELADMDPSCQHIRFGSNLTVLDTGTTAHVSMKDFTDITPDAIVGPFNEIPAFEMSVFATSLQIPLVSHNRAADPALLDPAKHPYFSQVSADPYAEMEFVGSFLNHTGRSDYIAIVYSSTPSVMHKVEILRAILDQGAVYRQVRAFGYHSMDTKEGPHDDSIRYALARVRETGFRTIVLLSGDLQSDADELQEAAEDLELNQGGHFWVLSGGATELSFSQQIELLNASKSAHGDRSIFKGAAYLTACDGFDYDFLNPFQRSSLRQDKAFMERLDAITPIPNYFDWSYAAESERIMETILGELPTWWSGTSYLYDAVISVGMGACKALTEIDASNETPGKTLLKGIRSVDFTGASGRVVFKDVNHGTRLGKNFRMSVTNLLPERDDGA